MPIAKSDIKFYLTSAEPNIEQTIRAQSIGGYPAIDIDDLTKSLVYPETTLAATEGQYTTQFSLTDASGLSSKSYLSANGEVVSLSSVASNIATVSRGSNDVYKSHISGDIIRGADATDLFNNNFGREYKQYRCIALRNNGSFVAHDVEIYIKQTSRNASSRIRVALESPVNDYRSASSTSNALDKITVTDSSSIGAFADNHFKDATMRFTGGSNNNQERTISSFDSSTGKFVLDSSLPFTASSGDTFEIDAGPAQRLASGINEPTSDSGRVTAFQIPDEDNKIRLDASGLRDHGDQLRPSDVAYIWIERTLRKDGMSFTGNSVVLSVAYSKV